MGPFLKLTCDIAIGYFKIERKFSKLVMGDMAIS